MPQGRGRMGVKPCLNPGRQSISAAFTSVLSVLAPHTWHETLATETLVIIYICIFCIFSFFCDNQYKL